MIQVHFAEPAVIDVELLLSRSAAEFGLDARERYQQLIMTAIMLIVRNPSASTARNSIRPGLHTFHLGLARRAARKFGPTVRHPRHFILWKYLAVEEVLIVRVLHDAMDLERHLPPEEEAEG